jgi:hypothetical protein
MSRHLIAVLVGLALTPAGRAQRMPGEPIKLVVSPAHAASPTLKYRLQYDRRDLTPGNAATLYYRSEAVLYENSFLLKELKEAFWGEWLEMPVDELPIKQMHEKVQNARIVLREIDLAGKRRDCDWQLDGRDEGIGLLIPDVQGYRNIASANAVKARLAIAEGRVDDAVATLRTGLTMGRHIADGPSMIHVLVGVAICQIHVGQLEDLLQHPDAPNMYWALTVMQHPLVDPRKAMVEESTWMEQMLPFLKRLESGPMSMTEVQDATAQLIKVHASFQTVAPARWQTLAQAAYIETAQKEARELLVQQGMKPDTVAAMPAFQAVSLYAWREYREAREEMLKWVLVPEGMDHPAAEQAAKRYGRAETRMDALFFRGLINGLSGGTAPAYGRVFNAANRVERRLVELRVVEALRMYAARHHAWPAKLDDIKDVPVPVDPITRKPFPYKSRGALAILTTPAPATGKDPANMIYTYELTLRK